MILTALLLFVVAVVKIQVAPNRGIFSLAKIREQKGDTTDFVCAVPFCLLFVRQKVRIEKTTYKLAIKIKGKIYRRIQKKD